MIIKMKTKHNTPQNTKRDNEIAELKRKNLRLHCIIHEYQKKHALCGWISVDNPAIEPPEDEELLLFCRGGDYDQLSWRDFGYYNRGTYYTIFTELDGEHDRVTHWMKIKPWPDAKEESR